MKIPAALTAGMLCFSALPQKMPVKNVPEGWLLWHSYSDYAAGDSRLFLRSPAGTVQEITGDFLHAMNGSFGRSPAQIVFMAIDNATDEWDIYLYDGSVRNLTPQSGCRNEDPKWSPDGSRIVFKRGRWDAAADDFVYDLALLDPADGTVTMLTDDRAEQAMPCFSADGSTLYYAEYEAGIGAICRMDLQTQARETIRRENGVTAYYPVVHGDKLYFTEWHSADNHCDRIMQYDGKQFTVMPFNSEYFDCSDACPAGSGMIYSSTQNGKYDLYYYDGAQSVPLAELNSDQNDLGACFFAAVQGDVNADGICSGADAAALRNYLLTKPDSALRDPAAADRSGDGILNAADLTLLKREIAAKQLHEAQYPVTIPQYLISILQMEYDMI